MRDLRRPRMAVAAMFVLNGALFGIWASRIPHFVDRFDLSKDMLGLLLLCLAGGAIVSFPVAGRLSDRMGAANLTRIIAVIYTLALALLSLAPSLPALALSLTLFGAAHGAMDVTMNAWAAEVERHLAKPIMSSFHAMFSAGAGLGAASGYGAVQLGIGVPLHFIAAAILIAGITLTLASRPWPSVRTNSAGPVFAIPTGPLIAVGVFAAAASLGEGAMADWSAVFLTSVADATNAQAALGYAVFSVAMVLMRLAGGAIVARFGPTGTARLSGCAALLGVGIAVLSSGIGSVLLGFLLMGIGYAVIMPLAFSRAAAERGLGAGRAIAGVATLGYGGMLLGPPLIGFVAELTSLRAAFGVLAGFAVLIIALGGVVDQRAKTD